MQQIQHTTDPPVRPRSPLLSLVVIGPDQEQPVWFMSRRVCRRRLNIWQFRHAYKKGEKPKLLASREERSHESHGHEVWHKSLQNGFVPLLDE
jgi:lipopolysaccharide/colanic/teichoic acid biosynthesis glycosyltransferase